MSNNFLTDDLFTGMNWRAMERAVARVLSHCGWSDVQVIGGKGDGGGDVLGKRSDKSGKQLNYVIQVKTIQGDRYVGPEAVDEVIRAMHLYGSDVSAVATNGDFTRSAYARVKELRSHGYECKLWNGMFLKELLKCWTEGHWQKRELRSYQAKVVDAVLNKYDAGGRTAQFVVATGLGKTTIASEIVNALESQGLTKILVLCHSTDLCQQLDQSFWFQLTKKIPTNVFFEGIPPKRINGVCFGTYQTMLRYLPGFEPESFDIVVIDEAHHALATGFLRCINYLQPRLLIGMTATPWRGDGLNLNQIFGDPVSTVSLVDGMKMGYLARVSYRIYCDTLDWENTPVKGDKKISIKDLNKRLFIPQRDGAIVAETIKVAKQLANPRIIFFCSSIEHGYRISDLVNATGILRCKPLSGVNKTERYKSLMEFSAGRIEAVTAVDVVNEGIDVPDVNIIVFLRVTHSRRIFVQQLGRGLRISADKSEVTVLDFVTDIRRIAHVLELDREARGAASSTEFYNVYFSEGIVQFENEAILPFAEQWLKDISDLETDSDTSILTFPPEV